MAPWIFRLRKEIEGVSIVMLVMGYDNPFAALEGFARDIRTIKRALWQTGRNSP
jgi:hypothetical protein